MIKITKDQAAALDASRHMPGFAYFMEMGLGKTLTDLLDTEYARGEGLQCAVVICPNSFKEGWKVEIAKWGFKFVPHVYVSGADTYNEAFLRRIKRAPIDEFQILITNYEAARTPKVVEYIKRFVDGRRAKITADESIQIKTHDSVQTKAAIVLSKDFERRRILCGKPMTQGPHDLWSQMRFIGHLNGMNYFAFRYKYCTIGGFKGKSVVGSKDEAGLAELISPYCYKAEKKDSMDLPKRHTVRPYDLGPVLNEHYNTMLHDFVVWLEGNQTVTIDVAIAKYAKLQQIQSGFIIDEEGKIQQLVPEEKIPKMMVLKNILEDELTSKICICYHHIHSGNALARQLAHYQPARIAGEHTMKENDATVEAEKKRFNEDPDCRVMLLQTRAAKYGHTLLGGAEPINRCYTMAFYENTYSLDDRSQIEDRIHRMGQLADGCLYIDFAGTKLDREIAEALYRKESIYQKIFSLVNRPVASVDA